METNLAILALTAMKIMLTGGISDEIQKGVLEKASDMSIDMAEEQIEKYKKSFNLNTQMDKCNVPYEKRDKVRDSIKAYLNYIDLEKIAKACGAELDRFENELMNLYDKMYKEDGENYEYIAPVLRNLAKHVLENVDVKSIHEKKFLEICHAELKSELTETIKGTAVKSVDEIKKYIDEAVARILDSLKNKNEDGKKLIVQNRCTDYRDIWNKNLFLNNPRKREASRNQAIKLSDLYIVPSYKFKQEDTVETDIEVLLNEVAIATEVDERMLVILGQPGSGKSSLITYFLNEYDGKLTRDVLVYRFTDFKKMDWNSEEIVETFVQRIGMEFNDLSGKILILDGFDEIYVENGEATLNHIKSVFANDNDIKDFSLFITCRGNYIEAEKLNCDYITIQSLDENQIEEYYTTYIDKRKSSGLAVPLSLLVENKDIFGIPIVLYMTLASNIKMTSVTETEANTPKTIVDIYDKIFDHENGGGLYDVENYKEEAHRVWLSENKKRVHKASREVACWMYQKNEGKDIIPQENFNAIIGKEGMDAKEVKIGNFFRHCEGTEGEDKTSVCFVHRSIYQYFVADAICSAVEKQIKAPTDENRKTFIKEIVPYIKEGELDQTIGEYLRYKFEKAYGIAKEKSNLFLWLEDALLGAVKTSFCGISGTATKSFQEFEKNEMNCFANILVILFNCRTWNIEGRKVMQDKQIDNLALYIRHNGIVVRRSLLLFNLSLKGANLIDANLFDADLFDADLRRANLIDANLSDADLRIANLFDANLFAANLIDADLSDANLRDANLSDAYLIAADLRRANLIAANLIAANLRDANLSDANLRDANLQGSRMLRKLYTEEEQIEYGKRGVRFE